MKKLKIFRAETILITALLLNVSCNDKGSYNIIKPSDVDHEVINESLNIQIPGEMISFDSCIVLTDPLNQENALNLYDCKSGNLILKTAEKGFGPHEILSPSSLHKRGNTLFLYDINLNKLFEYKINVKLKNEFTKHTPIILSGSQEYNLFTLNDYKYICNSNTENSILSLKNITDSNSVNFGEYPENVSAVNNPEIFQGKLVVTDDHKHVVYSMYNTPYFFMYNINQDSVQFRFSKHLTKMKQRIVKNKIFLSDDNIKGFMDMTVSNNRIYLLFSNKTISQSSGRNMESIPKDVLEFDFNGNQTRKLSLNIPTLRIAWGNSDLYGIALNEEKGFQLVKFLID